MRSNTIRSLTSVAVALALVAPLAGIVFTEAASASSRKGGSRKPSTVRREAATSPPTFLDKRLDAVPRIKVTDPEQLKRLDGLVGDLDERKTSRDALIAQGAPVVELMIGELGDPRWAYRWEAVNVLGYIEDVRAVAGLCARVLADDNPHVRWRALWAVKVTEPEGELARALFFGELDNPDPFIAWNAAIGLTMYEDPRSLDRVHGMLDAEDQWLRWEAVNALGRVNDETSSARLETRLFKDEDKSVRREASFVLGAICDDNAKLLMVRGLEHPDTQVRWRAGMGLGRCGDPHYLMALKARLEVEEEEMVTKHIRDAIEKLEKPKRTKRPRSRRRR